MSALAVALLAIAAPYPAVEAVDNPLDTHQTQPPDTATHATPALSSFESLWSLELQQPLYGTLVRVAAKPPSAPAPLLLGVRLAGTAVEPDRSVAMFITPEGRIELRGVGEKIESAEVLAIHTDSVSVRHAGKVIDLTIEWEDRSR